MKPEVLAKLHHATGFLPLTQAVLSMCEPFGPVHSFRLVHNRRAGRVACFIELEFPKHHAMLMRALGANLVGGGVCLDIPVGEDFASSPAAPRITEARRPAGTSRASALMPQAS